MIVTFISQCEKKALNRTRRVLDSFADRIGERTWQTVITEEGLLAVKKLLRKTVTKNTAVACHWIRSRSRTELIWMVGNRKKFNPQGTVPVNRTKRNHLHSHWENGWTFLPALKALVAVSALLHDWGKANKLFQEKLDPKNKNKSKTGDPLRHEWISCRLLRALVNCSGDNQSDEAWLNLLAEGRFDDYALAPSVQATLEGQKNPLANLPPLARMVAWLILSHHRLPAHSDKNLYAEEASNSIDDLLSKISPEWGYQNKYENDDKKYEEREKECFVFPQGLMLAQAKEPTSVWQKQLTKWTKRLLLEQSNIQALLANGSWRVVLQHARLCLMLGDHYYSSCETDCSDKKWQNSLYANTDKNRKLKQKLDEHLVNVSQTALRVCQALYPFSSEMAVAHDIRSLRVKSPEAYKWQDTAVSKITAFRKQNEALSEKGYGWFVVNMASTGCGKTRANAKMMRALSEDGDSLRYILALGLRTLTLQTGDEYCERIGLKKQELATLIGSSAIKELHEQAKKNDKDDDAPEQYGSDSEELLLDEDFDEDCIQDFDLLESVTADFLNAVLKRTKDKALLYIPVLVCTIDHIIGATETTRGGKYILPYLRLLSSDLVIDEVDDFDGRDLIAIGRLIHLAGMLGRKVMISSATIPPAVAEGLFNAYQAGWQLHCQLHQTLPQVACVWVDENSAQANFVAIQATEPTCEQYQDDHQKFTTERATFLQKQVVKRKGRIVPCHELYTAQPDKKSYEPAYFEKIKQTAMELHQGHHTVDKKTKKKISFGVVRVANVPPCINIAKYLTQTEWAEDFAPKIMAYHSRQVLLLRHEQEKHLDEVLQRKDEKWLNFNDPIIQGHLDTTPEQNILFIVVATPVEEVGRDHDFDWAIIEPSSYRSIIQLAGRVMRHREQVIDQPNIALMQYNLRALRNGNNQKTGYGKPKDLKPVFCHPGYESPSLRLSCHDLVQLVGEAEIAKTINALPRVLEPDNLNLKQERSDKLIDLEHKSLNHSLKSYQATGPKYLQAWLTECWWMTALPQQLNRFRESVTEVILYYRCVNGNTAFYERTEQGEYVLRAGVHNIKIDQWATEQNAKRIWLTRGYEVSLRQKAQGKIGDTECSEAELLHMMMRDFSRFGEITIPVKKADSQNKKFINQTLIYSDQFGLKVKDK